jgi:chromosome segregation ATPase
MKPSGDIPEFPPPKPRGGGGSAVKRPPPFAQESAVQRDLRKQLAECEEDLAKYRKQLHDTTEELMQSRAVEETLKTYFQYTTRTKPDVQRFIADSIARLHETEQMRTALREEKRAREQFEKNIQIEFKRELAEKEAKIRAQLQGELDTFIARGNRKVLDLEYELDSWKNHAEALRTAMRNMRRHHNNLVLQYEALRTRRTLRDITNDPDDDLADVENTGIVWMETDAQFIGEEQEDEKE